MDAEAIKVVLLDIAAAIPETQWTRIPGPPAELLPEHETKTYEGSSSKLWVITVVRWAPKERPLLRNYAGAAAKLGLAVNLPPELAKQAFLCAEGVG